MKHHFYRCGYLRLVSLDAGAHDGARRGGVAALDELCEAKALVPCVGIVACDVLALPQKRHLVALRATRQYADEEIAGLFDAERSERTRELAGLRELLVEEREQIAQENRRLVAELTAARAAHGVATPSEEAELRSRGISVQLDAQMQALRCARLDAIDGALAAMERGGYGACAACGKAIDVERLRSTPDARVCRACEEWALPPVEGPGADLVWRRH
jgi:DnaK suppressor protein